MVEISGAGGAASDRAVARILEARAATPAPAPTSPPQRTPAPASTAPTGLAGGLSGLTADLAAKAPVDADRLQQIKRAIANGTFPILPATVADRLLAVRYEWLGRDQA